MRSDYDARGVGRASLDVDQPLVNLVQTFHAVRHSPYDEIQRTFAEFGQREKFTPN